LHAVNNNLNITSNNKERRIKHFAIRPFHYPVDPEQPIF